MLLFRRLFYYLYPTKRRIPVTVEGKYVSKMMGWLVIFHFVFFLLSLVYIGFEAMLSEILWGCIAYSLYLKPR